MSDAVLKPEPAATGNPYLRPQLPVRGAGR